MPLGGRSLVDCRDTLFHRWRRRGDEEIRRRIHSVTETPGKRQRDKGGGGGVDGGSVRCQRPGSQRVRRWLQQLLWVSRCSFYICCFKWMLPRWHLINLCCVVLEAVGFSAAFCSSASGSWIFNAVFLFFLLMNNISMMLVRCGPLYHLAPPFVSVSSSPASHHLLLHLCGTEGSGTIGFYVQYLGSGF